jgi:hypothetical protein
MRSRTLTKLRSRSRSRTEAASRAAELGLLETRGADRGARRIG